MKFLNKLYRFLTQKVVARRVAIYLSVNLFLASWLTLAALSTSLIGSVIFMVVFIIAVVFNLDAMVWHGELIDGIEDKILEFKKFK